jgi:hypothetical protein
MEIIPKINEGFVYMHININKNHKNYNKKYIGYKSFFKYNGKESNWKIYIGSKNLELLNDFKELGWDGFKREYLFIGNLKDVREKEIYYHNLYNINVNDEFYNKAKQTNFGFSTSGKKMSNEEKIKRSNKMKGYKHIFNKITMESKMVPSNFKINLNEWGYGRPSNVSRIWIHNTITKEEKYILKNLLNTFDKNLWKIGRNEKMKEITKKNLFFGCRKKKSINGKKNMSLLHYKNKSFNVLNKKTKKIFYFYSLTNCKNKLNISSHFVKKIYNGDVVDNYVRI